jgi:UDP-N-acetylmuramoyl-L-alanyl-D-glutamate--2,6-diaminopimelate ligase
MPLIQSVKALVPERSPIRLGWHYAKAFIAALRYGFPATKLTVIGITGTDGKTTTVTMVGHILRHAHRKAGIASTIVFQIGDQKELNVTQKTSVSPFVLQKQLKRMVEAGCEFAVIEVSSHGLVQGRVHHIFPRVAAVTNTSEEHLDYHKTMEQYRKDKGKLFIMLKGKGTKILNGRDASFALYHAMPSEMAITYNTVEGDLWTDNVHITSDGTQAILHTGFDRDAELTLCIPGVFNLENAQCAIACCIAVGIPLATCLTALESFRGVEGRLEKIDEGQPFRVFIDFTVTPEAYRNILTTLRTMTPREKRILVLTSSCGNRMPEKRPVIGKICSELADIIVVTSDETYGEPHENVINEIVAGIDHSRTQVHCIPNRREAIQLILKQAQEGDSVVICGMAGVTTMMTAAGQVPWDERRIVQEELRKCILHS